MTHLYFIRKTLGIKDKNIHFEEQVTEERINDQNHFGFVREIDLYTESLRKMRDR